MSIIYGRLARMKNAAAEAAGVTTAMLLGERRHRGLVLARTAFAYEARKRGYSFPEIGEAINRDHTTIMHACQRAEQLQDNPDFKELCMIVRGVA